jgi:molybdopterin/thiamine biosynthesis adenylyltransferase
MRFVDTMRIVGPGVRLFILSRNGRPEPVDVHAQDSTIRLWGSSGQARLGYLRIAIAGLGGVGAILAEHVARLGIGELVLIDYDRLKLANKNRSQGATPDDFDRRALKIEVGERLARDGATAPAFSVTTIRGSIVEQGTVENLLDCDLILNAADSPWARQLLDHLAFAHLIPAINGGTELRGDPMTLMLVAAKSEVAVAGPGHPCFECADVYSVREASKAREHPAVRGERAYVKVGDNVPDAVRSPSMISTNALVAGLMQLRLQALALGTTPAAAVGTQRYHLLEGTADVALHVACKSTCERTRTTALGDLHDLPIGVDRDFEVAREEDDA